MSHDVPKETLWCRCCAYPHSVGRGLAVPWPWQWSCNSLDSGLNDLSVHLTDQRTQSAHQKKPFCYHFFSLWLGKLFKQWQPSIKQNCTEILVCSSLNFWSKSLSSQIVSSSNDQITSEHLPWLCPGAAMKSKWNNVSENACFPNHNTDVFIHAFIIFIDMLFSN